MLVLANDTCVGQRLFEEIRYRRGDGEDAEVILVAPALTSKVRYWLSDEDKGIADAQARIEESVERCGAAGIPVTAEVGDADPLQALDDAMRTYSPEEVIIATHPPDRSNWLEEGIVSQARERFDVPITHVVVDPEREQARVEDREPLSRRAPARERHQGRDIAILVIAGFLAIGGTVLSLFFYQSDVSDWFIWTWVLVFDLGLKLALAVVLWMLFQNRPRADRLDF